MASRLQQVFQVWALRVEREFAIRHLFFLGAAILVVTLYGYYFGTFDQASHIPFLKKTLDPTLFPNDHFFDLRSSHYSYFWIVFLPFLKAGILEYTMFGVHIVSTYFTFWAIWRLSNTLFRNTTISFVTVLIFIFPHIGFSGFPLFEFSMLNRTVCLPFELFAMNWFLKKKYVRTFLLLGLLYNLHALSVHFFGFMLLVDLIARIRHTGPMPLVKSAAAFITGALPVLLWKFGHSGISIMPHWEWFTILNRAVFFHLFNFVSVQNPVVLLLTASGISSIILYFYTAKHLHSEMHSSVRHWFIAGISVCVLQFFATLFFPATIVVQSQIMRIGIILVFITYLYLVAYVVSIPKKRSSDFGYLFIALLLSPSPLLFLCALVVYKKNIAWALRSWNLIVTTLFSIALAVIYHLNLWSPGFFIVPQKTPFVRAQEWAKHNTQKSAVFITPPEIWWMYETEWRVVSERSTVATMSELLEAAFDPAYISYWKPRFEDLAPGALQQFKGDFFTNKKITQQAFYSNSAKRFIDLGKKYNADYLVTDTVHRYALPIVYLNEGYIIYKIPR